MKPIPKVNNPQSFDQLRLNAINPLPSFLCERFVFDWALASITNASDKQQFGNIKSSSTTHYPIYLLDFVYKNLEQKDIWPSGL